MSRPVAPREVIYVLVSQALAVADLHGLTDVGIRLDAALVALTAGTGVRKFSAGT